MQPSFPALQRVNDTIKHPREGSLFHRQRARKPIIPRSLHVMARPRRERAQQARRSVEPASELRRSRQRRVISQNVSAAIVEAMATATP
jgi:hypothetical protein